jgi:hypothetical protein
MSDLDDRIAQLRKTADAAAIARLKAIAAKESQEQELAGIWDTLRTKYGVSTIPQLRVLLQTSQEGLETLIQRATEELRSA